MALEVWQPEGWQSVRAGFFGRRGGVSEGIFDALNCGLASGDERERIMENRTRTAQWFGQDVGRLCVASQIHSPDAVVVETPWRPEDSPTVDGMATNRSGIVLGVLTADCAPVLFADEAAGVIGAAHAGWKGALGGVVESTIRAMESLGAKRGGIRAAIGPCIAQDSYEVGDDLRRQFDPASAARFFMPGQGAGKFQFDLKGFVAHRLAQAGVGEVAVLPHDTRAEEARFFSYRRTALAGQAHYGRQLSAIVLP